MDATKDREQTKHGQGLLAKVKGRQHELEATLAHVGVGAPSGPRAAALSQALAALADELTGDTGQIDTVTAARLAKWLDATKYLADEPRGDA